MDVKKVIGVVMIGLKTWKQGAFSGFHAPDNL